MFVVACERSSETEAAMVKVIIDSVRGENTVLLSVASGTKNEAEKTCRILAGEENGVGCCAHLLHLAEQEFISAYTTSPNAPLESSVDVKVRRIARAFRLSPTWSGNLMCIQTESNVRSPPKYMIDVETRGSPLYLIL